MKNVLCSWSGGKDCSYALVEAKRIGYNPTILLNMMDDDCKTSRSHGLPVQLLDLQAEALGMMLMAIPTSREKYEENFINALIKAKEERNIQGVVYGDIDLVAHREWQERVCQLVGLEAIFPIWERKRQTLATEMIDAGIESMIVACNETMGPDFLGKTYNHEMLQQLKALNVCPCGEDGEFHSYVINSPIYKHRIEIPAHSTVFRNGFHFIQWED